MASVLITPTINYKDADEYGVIRFSNPFGDGCIQTYEKDGLDQYSVVMSTHLGWTGDKTFQSLDAAKKAIYSHAADKLSIILNHSKIELVE